MPYSLLDYTFGRDWRITASSHQFWIRCDPYERTQFFWTCYGWLYHHVGRRLQTYMRSGL